MTFLVTGAAGHFGALAVEALLDRGVAPGDIVATARDTDRLSAFAARGVVTRRLDYDDPASVDAALEGVDRLLLVSSSAVGKRVPQHRTVLEAAARKGVELVAYTSILRADSTSMALAAEHYATEQVLAELDFPHVLLRNGWYFENYTAQVPVHLEHGVLGAAGAGRISAATRADFAEAAAAALLADDSAGKSTSWPVTSRSRWPTTPPRSPSSPARTSPTSTSRGRVRRRPRVRRPAGRVRRDPGRQRPRRHRATSTTTPAPSARSSAGPRRRWPTPSRPRWSEPSTPPRLRCLQPRTVASAVRGAALGRH